MHQHWFQNIVPQGLKQEVSVMSSQHLRNRDQGKDDEHTCFVRR